MLSRRVLYRSLLAWRTHTSCTTLCGNPRRGLSSLPSSIKISEQEKDSGSLSWKNLELATRSIHRDGLVVLENAIDITELDFLNDKMVKDARTLQAAGENSPYNYNKGNIQQDPPMVRRYFSPSVFLNDFAAQVTTSVLGPKPRLSFVSGNTALPPTITVPPQSQPVHSDADFDHPDCPFALVVNVPLVEMNIENGSTEVWLGTHIGSGLHCQDGQHGDRASGRIKADFLEERESVRPPSQPVVPKGSIIIRDLRLWHAGKPNFTEQVRVMLAMIHFAPWYRNPMQVEFSEDLKPMMKEKGSGLQIQALFIPETEVEERYLNRPFGNAYNFNQDDPLASEF